jgi:peroxiredoxin
VPEGTLHNQAKTERTGEMTYVTMGFGQFPERGECLRDFRYVTVDGDERRLSDFKGRNNLLLILTNGSDNGLLDAVARVYPEIQQMEARVIAILKCERQAAIRARDSRHWPFDVAVDVAGALHRELGSEDQAGAVGTAVYITDRWAEVFFTSRKTGEESGPGIKELLDWLAFVDHQCPECFPSDWPA